MQTLTKQERNTLIMFLGTLENDDGDVSCFVEGGGADLQQELEFIRAKLYEMNKQEEGG